MDRIPAVVTVGAALLGYLGGAMIMADIVVMSHAAAWIEMSVVRLPELGIHLSVPGTIGALLVVAAGWWMNQRQLLLIHAASTEHLEAN